MTVNAASDPANGHSMIWEDHRRNKNRLPYSRSPYSAVSVAQASRGEEILYTTQTMRTENPHMKRVTQRDPDRQAWYEMGARLIGGE